MGDGKSALQTQATAATAALNIQPAATKMKTSASPTAQPQGPAAPVPQLSPTPGGRIGRRLHTKVLEELKNASSRKSPAINPSAAPAGTVPLPSPLNLHAMSSSDGHSDNSVMLDGGDTGSPRIPVPPNGSTGKSKTCGICERSFTVFRAKHTCKVCGQKICDDCSKNRVKLNRRLERRKGSRLCDACARDHIQLATPLLSPTQLHIPEEHDGTDDSGRGNTGRGRSGSGESGFALGGRVSDKTKAVADTPREAFHRASSAIFSSASAHYHNPSVEGESFLRPRHWLSLVGIACVLFARLVRFKSASAYVADNGTNDDLMVDARGAMLVVFSLTNWIDRLASLRVIGSYLLGLVVYDELSARSQRPQLRRTTPSMPRAGSSTTSSAPFARRTRTPSAFSESTRSTAGAPTPSLPTAVRERDEEEVLEVEVGDKHVDDGLGFSFDKFQGALFDCTTKNRTSDAQMKMSAFLSACDNVCGFILVFGRATAFAASTVTGYMGTITTNLAEWPVPASAANSVTFSWKEQSVRAIVAREVELHVAAAGGKKKPSCSRCVLRLLWFVEFVEACVRYTMIENTDEHCAAGASKAYEETLGVRHPWIIRKGVNSALGSLPSRSAIMSSLNLQDLSPDEAMVQLRKVQGNMRALVDEVTAVLKEHNLMDIK